jgi:hypothetical protein
LNAANEFAVPPRRSLHLLVRRAHADLLMPRDRLGRLEIALASLWSDG